MLCSFSLNSCRLNQNIIFFCFSLKYISWMKMLNWFCTSSFLRSIQVLSDIIIFSFFEGGPSVTGAAPLLAVILWNRFVIAPWWWYFLACVAISRRSPHHYKLHSMNLNLNIEGSKCWRIQSCFRQTETPSRWT